MGRELDGPRGMKFHRDGMPIDAVDTNIRQRVLVDASKELLAAWSEVRFKRAVHSSFPAVCWYLTTALPQDLDHHQNHHLVKHFDLPFQ